MNLNAVWKNTTEDLRLSTSKGTFNTFVAPSKLVDIDDHGDSVTAFIATTSRVHQQYLERRLAEALRDALTRAVGKPCVLRFSHDRIEAGHEPAIPLGPLFDQVEEGHNLYRRAAHHARLRSDFTFEQFAVSSTNEMAYAAAQAVSREPGQAYHLLFLFGGVGVGKTHLMQAIGHRILEKDPETRVLYKTGEDFTNEIIEAIQYKTTVEFRKRYRTVKALLIDDIQFIGGKDKVQEEFFHTFNAIHQEGGQIVLTSDQMPQDIAGLEDRLRSRLEGGLVIDIQQPSFELRTAILLIKAKAWGADIPMDAAQLVAANIQNTRALEGFLRRIIAEGTLRGEPPSKEMTERLLGSMKNADAPNGDASRAHASPLAVLTTVADVFSVKLAALKGKRRKHDIVTPRHLAMYLLRTDLGLPQEEIGSVFGGRDHTTVMYAVDKITAELPNDQRLRGSLDEIRKRLRSAVEIAHEE